jgi:flagellar biosynthesis GTPase FlhF
MTIITVRANDTATAMDEIVEKLGTEAYILDTKKVGNEMLVKATNKPTKKMYSGKPATQKFSSMMSKELCDKISGTGDAGIQKNINEVQTSDHFDTPSKTDQALLKGIDLKFKELRNMLDNMVLTDMAGLSPNLQSTTKIRLQKAGFSTTVLNTFKKAISTLDYEDGKNQFLNSLATSLANDDPDKAVLNSRFIFVLGASGSGKTSLSAKFAARIAQESDNRLVALGQLGVHKELQMDGLKSFSRLINVPNINLNPDNVLQRLMDLEQKVVVDVCTGSVEAIRAIQLLKDRVGSSNVLTVLISPAGSSKHSIDRLVKNFGVLKPLVACTKTDENIVSPEEFSSMMSHNLSIGFLTGTKSILESLSFVDQNYLAQYLKENLTTSN